MISVFFFCTVLATISLVTAGPIKSDKVSKTTKYPTKITNSILPMQSPVFLCNLSVPILRTENPVPTGPLKYNVSIKPSQYPRLWQVPSGDHPEVKEAIKSIDWSHVPNMVPRRQEDIGNNKQDPGCWWTSTLCSEPKVKYLPSDVTFCEESSDFGLTYDDGPLPPSDKKEESEWAEPRLYDFLASKDQKATLFYIGSNVLKFPQAAVRAIKSGHTLCVHTWSHHHMTGLTNQEIVAEFYWNLKVIKETTGVTPRCWRPPYGDVDDRVRAIAHQMGMLTIIWNSDSFDWGLPSSANDFKGVHTQKTIDGYFERWISDREHRRNKQGPIVLEHETSNMTILVTQKWLPKLQKAFDVKTVHECASQLENPYWEY